MSVPAPRGHHDGRVIIVVYSNSRHDAELVASGLGLVLVMLRAIRQIIPAWLADEQPRRRVVHVPTTAGHPGPPNLDGAVPLGDSGPQPKLLTYRQVAGALQVGLRTVEGLVHDGRLPTVRVGRYARVRPDDLDRYIEQLPDRTAA